MRNESINEIQYVENGEIEEENEVAISSVINDNGEEIWRKA